MRLAIDVSANIQQNSGGSRSSGKNRGQRGTVHAVQCAQHHLGCGHCRARIARGDKAGSVAFTHQPHPNSHRGVTLGAHRLHRFVLHGNDFAGVDDLDGQPRGGGMAIQLCFDPSFRPDQENACAVASRGINRAFDFRLGSPVRTHRIQRDHARHGGGTLAGFLRFHNFTALVIAALHTRAMRHLLFVTVRTLGERVAFQSIVRPAGRGALLRMSSFWIRHVLKSPSRRGRPAPHENQIRFALFLR